MINPGSSRNGVKAGRRPDVKPADKGEIARFGGDSSTLKSSFASQLSGIKPRPTASQRRGPIMHELEVRDTEASTQSAKDQVLEELTGLTIAGLKKQCQKYEIPGRSKINKENRWEYEDGVFLARGEEIKKRAKELFAAGASNRNAETEAILNTEISEGTTVSDGTVKTEDTPQATAEQQPSTSADTQEQGAAASDEQSGEESEVAAQEQTEEVSEEQTEQAQEENSSEAPEPPKGDEIVMFRSWMLERVFSAVLAMDLDGVKAISLPPGANKQVAVNFAILLDMVTKRGGEAVKTLLRTLLAKAKQGEEFTAERATNVMIKVVNVVLNGVQPLLPVSDRPGFRRDVAKFIGSRAAFDRADVVRQEIAEFEDRRSSRTQSKADDALDLLDDLGTVEDLDKVVPAATTVYTGPLPTLGQEYRGTVERYTRGGGLILRIETDEGGGTRTCVVHASNLDGGRARVSEHESDQDFASRIEGEFPKGGKHSVRILQISDGRKQGEKRIVGRIGEAPELPSSIRSGAMLSGVIRKAGQVGHKVQLSDTDVWGWMSRENTVQEDGSTPFFTPDDEVFVEIMSVKSVGPQGIPLVRPEPQLRLIRIIKQQRAGQSGRFALSVRFTPVVLSFIDASGIELSDEQKAVLDQTRQYLGRIEGDRVVDYKQFNTDGDEGFNPNAVIAELIDQLDPDEAPENDDVRIAAGQVVRQVSEVRREPTEIAIEALDGVDATCLNELCGHPGPILKSASGFSMIRPDIPGKLLAVVPEDHRKRDVAERVARIAGNKRPTCRDGGNKVLKLVVDILNLDGLNEGRDLDDLCKAAGFGGGYASIYKRLNEITEETAQEMEPLLEEARKKDFWKQKAERAASGGAHH